MSRPTANAHYPSPGRALPAAALLLFTLVLAGCGNNADHVRPDASQPLPLPGHGSIRQSPLNLQAEDVLMQALGLIGTRYRYGGSTPETGFDCSGFTSFVFREAAGVALPRTAREQFAAAGTPIAEAALAPGDLVFFLQAGRQVDHVGIYLGDGRFVHAPSRGGNVRIDRLDSPWWTRTFRGARRVLAAP